VAKRKKQRESTVLVLGAGIAGTAVAVDLARSGREVDLIERQSSIGGHAAQMGCKATNTCQKCNICVADKIFRSVSDLPNIRLHLNCELAELKNTNGSSCYAAYLKNGISPGEKLAVDNVVVATGFEPYDPAENSSYGYGETANIITGLEAERQLRAQQRIVRPSDGWPAKRIAFVQCVGSRTEEIHRCPEDTNYCSTVCCSYALRLAQLMKYQSDESDIAVFYMDIQNFGKNFDRFYGKCKDKMRFVRSRPYEIKGGCEGAVSVKYTPQSGLSAQSTGVCREEFDLVILSVGIRPAQDNRRVADNLLVPLDENGFFGLKNTSALPELNRNGIYVAGACEGPKDIAGSIVQARAVSAAIISKTGDAEKSSTQPSKTAKTKKIAVNHDVAIVGGGIAAMQTATTLIEFGHKVNIVTKDSELGGEVGKNTKLYSYLSQNCLDVRKNLDSFKDKIEKDSNVKLYRDSSLKKIAGEFGNFSISLNSGSNEGFSAGAVVLATSCSGTFNFASMDFKNTARYADINTLSEMIDSGNIPGRVAIVLDMLGEQTRSVWAQVLGASEILLRRFGCKVKIYCRNARVAATGLEEIYQRVRAGGGTITKFNSRPIISEQADSTVVETEDDIIGASVSEKFDLVVMADAVADDPKAMADIVGQLRTGPNGALQYDNVWLLPTESNRKGVFVVGSARGNSDYREALADGIAAAKEIHDLLKNKEIEIVKDAPVVDDEKCVFCLTCRRICPHGAISLDVENKAVYISEVSCRRCGLCAAECPAGAIELGSCNEAEPAKAAKITVFACENSAILAAEAAEKKGLDKIEVELISVPCAGKVDPKDILSTLEKGAEKVIVLGCHPESCQYLMGASRAVNRIKRIGDMLERAGSDRKKVSFGGLSSVEAEKIIEYIKE